jgi:hypothetical protein
MDANGVLDVLIGVAQATLGLFLAWKAFVITLKAPAKSERSGQKRIFVACGLAVICLAGIQTYRSLGLSQKLTRIELNTAASLHAHINVEGPYGVTGDPYLPYKAGHVPQVGIIYQAMGEQPADDSYVSLGLDVVPLPLADDDEVAVWRHSALHGSARGSGTLNPHSPGASASVTTRSSLSDREVLGLNDGVLQLCVTVRALWKDQTGGTANMLSPPR